MTASRRTPPQPDHDELRPDLVGDVENQVGDVGAHRLTDLVRHARVVEPGSQRVDVGALAEPRVDVHATNGDHGAVLTARLQVRPHRDLADTSEEDS
ncbi:hypothetical protein VV01_01435 [Luteipulveratus halotolerans]|uniref:Uncharacterized protein n=1 Tax=Luteipulveratus halotolerans TaxID=1631356 RepID=A0A0L6CF29_9MICO|nr:hypothetical protein VV01_01435 [Luteipulveratus halotolerans]